MLFPLGFDAKLEYEQSESKEETNFIISFMFHPNYNNKPYKHLKTSCILKKVLNLVRATHLQKLC